MSITKEITQVENNALKLYQPSEIEQAFDNMAEQINVLLADKNPIILCVLTGGIVPTGHLLTRLNFPLQLDYIHATRYQGKTKGATLHWKNYPQLCLKNRHILIIDDILDQGHTLAAIIDYCKQQHCLQTYSAVLVQKDIPRDTFKSADFTGFTVPNLYVFGYGMDYKDYLRNAAGIYAVKDET